MTVKELIERLKEVPKSYNVRLMIETNADGQREAPCKDLATSSGTQTVILIYEETQEEG